MNLKVFKKLSTERQLDEIICFGKPIDKFVTEHHKVTTYQMNGFVVDSYRQLKTNSFYKLYF